MKLQHTLIETHWGSFQTTPLIFTLPCVNLAPDQENINPRQLGNR